MTVQQYSRAQDISTKLVSLTAEKAVWEKASKFNSQSILSVPGQGGQYANIPPEDFETLRAIRLQKIQSEIKTLTQEFEQL